MADNLTVSAPEDTSTQEEHENEMLGMSTSVRDGDDEIVVNTENNEEDVDGLNDSNNDSNSDSDDTPNEGQTDKNEDVPNENQDGDKNDADEGEPKDALEASTKEVQEALKGNDDLINTAKEKGVTDTLIENITNEINSGEGISEKSYKDLEKAGYSKAFVDSYVRGQEAIGEQFANSIVAFSGGAEAFADVQATIGQDKAMTEAFNAAIERADATTIKALISGAKATHKATFGSRPAVNLTQAKPKVTPKAATGFTSQEEMVKAMGDPRYQKDDKFRADVEQKLLNSSFF